MTALRAVRADVGIRTCHSEAYPKGTCFAARSDVGIRNLFRQKPVKSAGFVRFRNGLPRQCEHWLGMTALRAVQRVDKPAPVIPRSTPRAFVPLRSTAGRRPLHPLCGHACLSFRRGRCPHRPAVPVRYPFGRSGSSAPHNKQKKTGGAGLFYMQLFVCSYASMPRLVRYFLTIRATLKVMASSNSRRSRPVSFLIFSSR